MTSRERVEIFHLLFVRQLAAQLEDRSLVSLKGGGNLRFFFGSPRFSEDLDFDVRHIAQKTLEKKIGSILGGSTLARLLAAHALRIEAWSAPKQTELVQRWKASIVEGEAPAEPTKLEFSRRPSGGEHLVEAIPAAVLQRHKLAGPVIAGHYSAEAAARQKIGALVGRAVPQTRDVFDLNLLLDRATPLPPLSAKERNTAIERVMEFTFDEFEGQVVAFLEPADADAVGTRDAFEAMQLRVAGAIGAAS